MIYQLFHLAHQIEDFLVLATSGPLEGKYLYFKFRLLVEDYAKKCSSVLGISYIKTKYELLISDNLSPDVLISDNPFEALRKGSTTLCKGSSVGV